MKNHAQYVKDKTMESIKSLEELRGMYFNLFLGRPLSAFYRTSKKEKMTFFL